jgi:hypothetical protein
MANNKSAAEMEQFAEQAKSPDAPRALIQDEAVALRPGGQ